MSKVGTPFENREQEAAYLSELMKWLASRGFYMGHQLVGDFLAESGGHYKVMTEDPATGPVTMPRLMASTLVLAVRALALVPTLPAENRQRYSKLADSVDKIIGTVPDAHQETREAHEEAAQ